MENIEKRKPVLSCVILFAMCGLARLIEYFMYKNNIKKAEECWENGEYVY